MNNPSLNSLAEACAKEIYKLADTEANNGMLPHKGDMSKIILRHLQPLAKDRERMDFLEDCMTRIITYSEPETNGDWHRLEYWERKPMNKTHIGISGPSIRAAIDRAITPQPSSS
jgi:hypothetical protein